MSEDSIVNLALLPPSSSVDLGARSLVSGVGCNAPGFFPKLELTVILFLHHHDISIMHIIFWQRKLLFLNLFYFSIIVEKKFIETVVSVFEN